MKLKLIRTEYTDTYTMGDLYVNDEFFCNTIEDRYRNLETEAKVPGETAIPLGTYKVIVNMSPRFGRELPRLLDVPHFEGVLIHRGNTAEDSAGCIILGEKGISRVNNSTPYEIKLTEILKEIQSNGETIEIEIV